MKKRLFIIGALFVYSLALTFPVQASNTRPQILLNDSNKEPFTTKNRDGFLDLVLQEAFKRIGFNLKTVQLPPERGLLSANAGIVDGEVNRIAGLGKIYKNLIKVPEKIRDSEFCALSKDANIVNTPKVLNQHVVGHIKGWKVYDKMMAGSSNVITANSPKQLFRLLNIDRIDVALYSCVEGLELAQQLNMKNIHVLKPAFTQTALFVYLNKRHIKLVAKLSQVLQDLKKEGFYGKLYREKIEQPYYLNTHLKSLK